MLDFFTKNIFFCLPVGPPWWKTLTSTPKTQGGQHWTHMKNMEADNPLQGLQEIHNSKGIIVLPWILHDKSILLLLSWCSGLTKITVRSMLWHSNGVCFSAVLHYSWEPVPRVARAPWNSVQIVIKISDWFATVLRSSGRSEYIPETEIYHLKDKNIKQHISSCKSFLAVVDTSLCLACQLLNQIDASVTLTGFLCDISAPRKEMFSKNVFMSFQWWYRWTLWWTWAANKAPPPWICPWKAPLHLWNGPMNHTVQLNHCMELQASVAILAAVVAADNQNTYIIVKI